MTETIDKLYLELSNVTQARNRREIDLATLVARMSRALKKVGGHDSLVGQAEGFLERHGMTTQTSILRGDQ
jgi:hypothetical protein